MNMFFSPPKTITFFKIDFISVHLSIFFPFSFSIERIYVEVPGGGGERNFRGFQLCLTSLLPCLLFLLSVHNSMRFLVGG